MGSHFFRLRRSQFDRHAPVLGLPRTGGSSLSGVCGTFALGSGGDCGSFGLASGGVAGPLALFWIVTRRFGGQFLGSNLLVVLRPCHSILPLGTCSSLTR